jgi:hypothetical protein
MASELILQLYSQNHWTADGSQTVWNFTFENGYLSQSYVKAYYVDLSDNRTDVVVTGGMFTGEYQLTVTPAVPINYRFVIYRDTPKNAPIVDFMDGARVSELSLDQVARQAVHIAAEVMDGAGASLVTSEMGYKSLKQVAYTGASTILSADNGKAHYKIDGTTVTVPNTLPNEFLTTIINNSAVTMTIAFSAGVAYIQGTQDAPVSSFPLAPRNTLTITKIASGVWYVAGKQAA